jgi:hypothetical protein
MKNGKKGALFAVFGFAAVLLAAMFCMLLISVFAAGVWAWLALTTGLAVSSFAILAGANRINAQNRALPDARRDALALNVLSLMDNHNNLVTMEDCRDTLVWLIDDKNSLEAFTPDFVSLKDQIDSFHRKKKAVEGLLQGHFSETEMTYVRFKSTLDDAESVFLRNIRSVLIRLNAFDEADFNRLRDGGDRFTDEIAAEKKRIYGEYFEYGKTVVRNNDAILIKLDAFLSEISKLGSFDAEDADGIEAVKDLEALVSNVKKYKNA